MGHPDGTVDGVSDITCRLIASYLYTEPNKSKLEGWLAHRQNN